MTVFACQGVFGVEKQGLAMPEGKGGGAAFISNCNVEYAVIYFLLSSPRMTTWTFSIREGFCHDSFRGLLLAATCITLLGMHV